ncbi:atp dependent dna helicase [Fusarium austroafricanum]|uniref:Atp dependent dna helicase n=1 Tax=Fusarium austroafricanum TaxID=2364996 RepID=A0A8H4NVK2_9HYPO|nr:atp dependent dna helicase [Fusarium austroafricanum]
MTRLGKAEWWLCDGEKIDTELRIRQRTMFAETLKKIPMSLTCFRLNYIREPPRRRSYQPESIIPSGESGDILSRSFFSFTQRNGLDDFYLEASVDSTILWPCEKEADANWPSLRVFHIELNDVLPSGEWVDVRDFDRFGRITSWVTDEHPESEIPGEEYFFEFPSTYDQSIIDKFAFAAGKCLARMLKVNELNVFHHGHSDVGLAFNTTDQAQSWPVLELVGSPDAPEPSEETLEVWKEAVKSHGLEWRINITDDLNGVYYFY